MADQALSLGYESLNVTDAAVVILAKVPRNVDSNGVVECIAHIQCAKLVDGTGYGNVSIRYTDDGTTPTQSVGIELAPGGPDLVTCVGVSQLQFIAVGTSVKARLNIRYAPYPDGLNAFPTR